MHRQDNLFLAQSMNKKEQSLKRKEVYIHKLNKVSLISASSSKDACSVLTNTSGKHNIHRNVVRKV